MRLYKSILLAAALTTPVLYAANKQPNIIPAPQKWIGAEGTLNASTVASITYAKGEKNKAVLSLAAIMGKELETLIEGGKSGVTIDLTLSNEIKKDEGYTLTIGDKISIKAKTTTGLYYGSRTLLQMLQQSSDLPKGTISDAPKYPVRSVLLDVGRKFMPVHEVKDWIRMMGWLKLNELHFHLNDNSWGRYPGYRLESKKFPGLASKDGHYTFKQIRELQDFAKNHGVTIVPEIDTPGHSLAFTTYKPELAHPALDRNGFGLAYLNIHDPKAMEFVQQLWDEVIPHFDSKTVHIGTDEYRTNLIKDKAERERTGERFRQYINELASYIQKKHKKEIRMWSGYEHQKGTTEPNKSIVIDMWETSDAKVKSAAGYKIVNSSHFYTYVVPGAPYYGVNNTFIYNTWTPKQFSGKPEGMLGDNDPNLLGGKLHVWNDYGPTGYTWNEITRLTLPSMAAMGEKLWGTKGAKDYKTFQPYATALTKSIPGVSLINRRAATAGQTSVVWKQDKPVLHIGNTKRPLPGVKAHNLEYPWTASFTITRHNDIAGNETLISSDLSAFYLDLKHEFTNKKTRVKTVKRGVACVRANQAPGFEPIQSYKPDILIFDYEVPLHKKVTLTFVGQRRKTSLYADGKLVGSINKQMVCPLTRFGHVLAKGFHGTIHNAKITSVAPESKLIGTWSPANTSTKKAVKHINISKLILDSGIYEIEFDYTRGDSRLDIHKVELLENGASISTDEHLGSTGGSDNKNIFSLKLQKYKPKAKYEIRFTSNADGSNQSFGNIKLKKAISK